MPSCLPQHPVSSVNMGTWRLGQTKCPFWQYAPLPANIIFLCGGSRRNWAKAVPRKKQRAWINLGGKDYPNWNPSSGVSRFQFQVLISRLNSRDTNMHNHWSHRANGIHMFHYLSSTRAHIVSILGHVRAANRLKFHKQLRDETIQNEFHKHIDLGWVWMSQTIMGWSIQKINRCI